MPLTLDQIVEETRDWPFEKVDELVERLTARRRIAAPEIEAAWKEEIQRRIADIESGKVKGVPVEESLARARKIAGL